MFDTVPSLAAARLLTQPGTAPCLPGGRLTLADGLIRAIEPGAPPAGARDLIAMPALGNAHDHGRGVKFLAVGIADGPLEAWVPGFYSRPVMDIYANAALIMAHFAESGIASAVHCHQWPMHEAAFETEIEAVARAARDVGIRLGIVVPMRDRNRLCYGDDDAVLALLAAEDREAVAAIWGYDITPVREQVARVEHLARRFQSDLVSVQLGPLGVQWASNPLLEAIAEASARTGLRVHMHLLESRQQREWLDRTYPDGVVTYLDHIGLLSERLTVAHGVWLRPDEIELLAEREVIVSLNSSSNLRLGSGIAPARAMVAKHLPMALGLDGMALDDDDDALREMRLADVLHRGPGFDDPLPRADLFAASMRHAPRAVTGRRNHGSLEPGMAADIVTLDYGAMTADVIDGLLDPTDLVLARAATRHVVDLVVAGRRIVRDGQVLGVDLAALQRELTAQIRSQKDMLLAKQPLIARYRDAMTRYYRSGGHTRDGA
jgi:cytosine/adenosine deaminase-related metal-dependent hydrolase